MIEGRSDAFDRLDNWNLDTGCSVNNPGFELPPQKLDELHRCFMAKYETAFELKVK